MERMKRAVCLLLTLFMVVGMLPMGVFATEPVVETEPVVTEAPSATESESGFLSVLKDLIVESEDVSADTVEAPEALTSDTIYVLAGGDFQEAGDHANSAANVTNILEQVSQKYSTMDGFLFIGDYDCESHNDATETANGITALMGAVQGKYSNLNDANSVLVQGNHDYMDSRIDATGGHEFEGYAAYVLNEDDYPNGGGSQSQIQTLANDLKTWLNNKIGEGYSAPIFVVSHLPLAYTPRTVTQGDAMYAKYIFDVLNDAGKNGLNIIFLHGHDHAYGPDNYMGGEAIYLPVGDKICIAETGSTSSWTEETLSFTYMNAGYTGYYSDPFTYVTTAGTDKLTMTVFAITDNEVTVERYSEDGLYNLKSAGYDGSYSNTSVTNVSLGLPKYSAVYASPQTIALVDNGASDMGTIGEWVGIEAESTDDVTVSNEGWVELIAPVPDTPAVPGSTTYKYVLDTDGVNTNTKYLIVNTSSNGYAYALTNNNGTVDRTQVSISNSEIIVEDETNVNWIFSGSESGTIVNQNRYIYLDRNTNLSLTESGTAATFSNQGNGAYRIYRYSNSRYNYLRYSSNSWSKNSTRNESDVSSVYLFTYDSTINTEGTPAIPGTNGTYGKIAGDLTYNATAGMTADQAMGLVQGGIDGYYVEAMSTPGDVTGTIVDDSVLTWEWVDTFDGSTAGDYEVAIKYGDFLLGTAEVVVPASTTYYAAEGNGLYLVDMNTTEANAMAAVKAGVTVYSATDASGSNKTAISDDDVTWNWVDKYNGADSGPYTVEILKGGTSLGTVEVKVDIQYETGIKTDWTEVGETEATGGSFTYTLDTDGIDYGEENKYIIVDDNEPIVLNAQSSSNGTAHSITISGNTATTTTRDYEYHVLDGFTHNGTAYHKITKGDGTQYLYQESNGVRYGQRSDGSVKFAVEHMGNGLYRIRDIDGTQWCVVYNGSWTVLNNTNHPERVRFYKYTGTTGGTPGGPIYALIEGNTVYTVTQGSSATKAMAAVKAGITGYTATDANGSNKTELADSDLTWKWKNTFNGNSTGSYWVEISYQGKVLGTVEVKVEPGVVNNYPEYPNEGSVKVSKTGTGIDFQSSGIARVEVSASGVPIKKGADVIVMLDTSSSMTSHTVTGTSKTRAEVLEESLKNLIAQFKTPGDDGEMLDLRVAIADFNGFYGENHNASGTPYDRDAADMMSDDISYNANSEAKIYTGDGTLGAGAFIPVEDLAASYTLNYTSGTNYDYAMDAIYQMGTAIKEANGADERDLYVIFMSDGAAMQWNYYHSQGASSLWNNWITGAWSTNQLSLNCNTHAYYYDDVDHNGDGMRNEHRMANAIKGDPAEEYEVIRKTNTLGTPTDEENMYMVPGLGATMFSISFDAKADTNVTEQSMDKSIASLASEQTGTTQYYYKVTTADELNHAFDAIGSEIAYAAYNARFVDQMGDDYNLQMAVSNYSVVDGTTTTGKTITPKIEILSYDIYTRQDYLNGTITEDKIGDRKGTYTVLEEVTFNADGTEAYSDKKSGNILVNGVINAQSFWYNTNATAVAVEGVSIPTGTKADGTTTGSTNMLPSETFYWKMGTVQTSELAMRYYVYLEGSMEGTRKGGSYPTNEYATLYYDNYLHNPCKKDTVSPVMPWKEANVSYAFYLVNEKGEIIVNQTTGQTGSFANKIAVTNPVVFDTVLLNTSEEIDAVKAAEVLPNGYTLFDATYDAEGKITDGATYTVTVNSNTTGGWNVTSVKNVDTTYVMHFDVEDASAYSKEKTVSEAAYDYTHTVVWFAVVWKIQALPDTVVIDYGLPVDISVLTNDMFGENGKLAGVGAISDSLNLDGHTDTKAAGFGETYTGTYGVAKADASTGKVRYTLNTSNGMQMQTYEKFAYAVNYTGATNPGYYYDTVTVIPATTIYYEDTFLNYSSYEWDYEIKDWGEVKTGSESLWTLEAHDSNKVQAEDRPGEYSLTDANNIYGYDAVNNNMSIHSLDKAAMVTVDYDKKALADFTFCGTGFDVVSMTSSETGTILVDVYPVDADGKRGDANYNIIVDSYYGYDYCLCNVTYQYLGGDWVRTVNGRAENATEVVAPNKPETPKENDTVSAVEYAWILAPDADAVNAIYQVPLIQVSDMPYGRYEVVITVTYDKAFDHVEPSNETGKYDFYLDAVRIYDPANDGAVDDDTVIEDAYKADGEGWPTYIELREKILDSGSFDKDANAALKEKMAGLVFIDGDPVVGNDQIANYESYGPNNEVYLAPGQSIAFILNKPDNDNVANVHIGIKSADGSTCQYSIKNIARNGNSEAGIAQGSVYHEKTFTVNTSTDMYYDLTEWTDDIIVITNTGSSGIISLTNIKSTYKSDPYAAVTTGENGAGVQSGIDAPVVMSGSDEAVDAETLDQNITYIYMTASAAAVTVDALNGKFDEDPAPDASEPEETEPEATEPEVTEPEETEPEATEPETFEPEVSVKLNKTSVRVGQMVQVKVTTSADVAYVTVNGETVTNYSVNRRTGERTWSINITAEEAGRMNIEVIAYNGSDIAAEPVVKTVNVTKKSGGFFGGFFGWIFG